MGCDMCDGYGIMTLTEGLRSIKAPCLQCSPDRRLEDLERERDGVLYSEIERREIVEHNKRMAGI